jgi:transglutaminase-like putative cysteine protease
MSDVRLEVRHQTRYDYSARVDVAHHIAFLLPRAAATQAVVQAEVAIEPVPSQRSLSVDSFGNARLYFSLTAPHERLLVHARSVVELAARPPVDPDLSAPWHQVRRQLRYAAQRTFDPATEFTFASPFVPRDPELARYAAPSFGDETTVVCGALELMTRIHRDFRYEPASTEVSTPVMEAFQLRHGVCQDFAHVMIGALRSIGLAARYVSGYLVTRPAPGTAPLVGADASHAWVSVYCPQLGWIDLDPTNDLVVDQRHVTLAIGRDYGDVTPLRGVIRGGGAHTLNVGVSVVPR